MGCRVNKAQIAHHLLSYPGLELWKHDGIYYLVGDAPQVVNHRVERCLHVVRLSDITPAILDSKIAELTDKKSL